MIRTLIRRCRPLFDVSNRSAYIDVAVEMTKVGSNVLLPRRLLLRVGTGTLDEEKRRGPP